jgi:hypothetical protein
MARVSVAERFAVNASPLIFLAQAGLLDLLRVVGDGGIVPTTKAAPQQSTMKLRTHCWSPSPVGRTSEVC